MSEELEPVEGVSRRNMLKKSALVGGTMVWAAPVVQSFTAPAFAQTSPEGGETQDISFVAILLNCGGQLYRVKFEDSNNFGTVCGRSFSVSQCNETLRQDDPAVAEGCPTGVSAVENANGSLTVNLGGCEIVDFVVKCGEKAYQTPGSTDHTGCQDYPEEVVTPDAGDSGTVTFYPCSTTGPTGS